MEHCAKTGWVNHYKTTTQTARNYFSSIILQSNTRSPNLDHWNQPSDLCSQSIDWFWYVSKYSKVDQEKFVGGNL